MTADWHVEDADGRVEPIKPRLIDDAAGRRVFASPAFAHVTTRPCRECDGTGIYLDANGRDHECKDCCATGWELQ